MRNDFALFAILELGRGNLGISSGSYWEAGDEIWAWQDRCRVLQEAGKEEGKGTFRSFAILGPSKPLLPVCNRCLTLY